MSLEIRWVTRDKRGVKQQHAGSRIGGGWGLLVTAKMIKRETYIYNVLREQNQSASEELHGTDFSIHKHYS